IGGLTGPVSKPNTSTDRLNAVKILLDLLQESGLVAGDGTGFRLASSPAAHVLGPSGAEYLRSRVNRPDQRPGASSRTPEKLDQPKERQIPAGQTTPTTDSTGSRNKLDEYFQVAMNRFLKEQNFGAVQPPPLGTQDVDISDGTPDLDSWEYDPDDLVVPSSSGQNAGRAAVATAAIGTGYSTSLIQRVRISAISDLKEFTGKDMDEDRARAWIGKVKSAFQRDQATEEEKCLTFGDLMVGSAKNWHRQLSRTKWADLLESFQTQYIVVWACQLRGNITMPEKDPRRPHWILCID
ncbi:LOW QUALITY PROTEIN: hypothetical protein PHMEG_00041192, partial [Phytophthora megakarya]